MSELERASKPKSDGAMTPAEYRQALYCLDMSPAEFARLIGIGERNARRFAEEGDSGPGPAASFALRCLVAMSDIAAMPEAALANPSADWREVAGEMHAIAIDALRGKFEG